MPFFSRRSSESELCHSERSEESLFVFVAATLCRHPSLFVSTRVLTPFRAVLWAAFWNFIAAFVFGTAVAKTIGKGMVHIEMVNEKVLLAGLLGAITWNTITLIL